MREHVSRWLRHFPYDPSLRLLADLEPAERVRVEIGASAGEPVAFERFARARFTRGRAGSMFGSRRTAAASSYHSRTPRAGPKLRRGRYLLDR